MLNISGCNYWILYDGAHNTSEVLLIRPAKEDNRNGNEPGKWERIGQTNTEAGTSELIKVCAHIGMDLPSVNASQPRMRRYATQNPVPTTRMYASTMPMMVANNRAAITSQSKVYQKVRICQPK